MRRPRAAEAPRAARAVELHRALWCAGLLLLAAALPLGVPRAAAQSSVASSVAEAGPMLLRTEASRARFEQGHAAMLAFRLPEAERHFRVLAARPDGAAVGHYALATVAMYKGMVTDDADYFETFFKRSDRFGEALEEAPEGRWRAHLRAEGDLQRALVSAKTQSYLRAALAARSAYNGFEELMREHPSFAEPKLGMGLLHLTVASLPGGWRRLLGVMGFSGTAEEGLREMEAAAAGSRYNRAEATMALSVVDVMMYQATERALRRLRRLYEAQPQSLLYAHLYGFALLADRQAQAAAEVLRRAARRHTDEEYFFIDYVEYYLGEALFRLNEFGEAERYLRRYLARHGGPALKAPAQYMLGLALELQGEREEALAYYELVNDNRDFDSDAAAYRAAQERIEAPLEGYDYTLLMARNAFDAGRYAQAEQLLRPVYGMASAPAAARGEAAYRLGRVYHVQGQLRQAAEAYAFAAAQPGDPRAKWGPWSQFYLGEIHAAQGRDEQALDAYEKALDYETPFDYAQSLEQTVRVAREGIQGGT